MPLTSRRAGRQRARAAQRVRPRASRGHVPGARGACQLRLPAVALRTSLPALLRGPRAAARRQGGVAADFLLLLLTWGGRQPCATDLAPQRKRSGCIALLLKALLCRVTLAPCRAPPRTWCATTPAPAATRQQPTQPALGSRWPPHNPPGRGGQPACLGQTMGDCSHSNPLSGSSSRGLAGA